MFWCFHPWTSHPSVCLDPCRRCLLFTHPVTLCWESGHTTLTHLRSTCAVSNSQLFSWISLFYGHKFRLALFDQTDSWGAEGPQWACSEYSLEVRDAASVHVMTTTSMYRHTSACKHNHPCLGLGQDNEIWDHQLPLLSWLSSSSSSLFIFFIFSSLSPECCIASSHSGIVSLLFVLKCVSFLCW